MKKHKTKVITDESQVPVGFKRISVIADSLTDQKKLSDAHTDGLIAAVKLMRSTEDRTGPVWVDANAAALVLHGTNARHACKPGAKIGSAAADNCSEAAVIALCEINNGITLMQATLERLAAAVEKVAQHPLARLEDVAIVEDATEGAWRDMNGECH
jgi:hypothetical protein